MFLFNRMKLMLWFMFLLLHNLNNIVKNRNEFKNKKRIENFQQLFSSKIFFAHRLIKSVVTKVKIRVEKLIDNNFVEKRENEGQIKSFVSIFLKDNYR